jgi:hypothetical protein
MKLNKFITGLAIAAGTFSISSCSEDFEVAAPYKDVTVVYGLLNVDDTVHYIRIQKAFMDENRSAVDLAKIADSSYYRNLEVHLKALNNGNITSDDVLTRVDLAAEGLPKQPGAFFDAPNYAYKASRRLNPAYTYRLVIKNIETGNIDSAETNIINSNPANQPGNFVINSFSNANFSLSFFDQPVDNNFRLTVGPPTNASYFEGYIRFRYVSLDNNTGVQTDSSFVWRFASSTAASPNLITPRTSFFNIIRDNMKVAPPNISRFIDSGDVFVWAANEPYYLYLQNSRQSGITADQIRINYTNVKGKDVLGLLASRAMRIKYNVPVDLRSLDSLKVNNLTKDLRIVGFSDH